MFVHAERYNGLSVEQIWPILQTLNFRCDGGQGSIEYIC